MSLKPVEFRRVDASSVRISWSDGSKHEISAETLRKNCPCASCKESRGDESHQKPLTARKPGKSALAIVDSSRDEALKLEKIWAVGNYALGVQWGDGHQTGIYTYDLLHELAVGS